MKMIYKSLGHEYMSKRISDIETSRNNYNYSELDFLLHVDSYDEYDDCLVFYAFTEILENAFEFKGDYGNFIVIYGSNYTISGFGTEFFVNTDFVIDCLGQYKYIFDCYSGFQSEIDKLINTVLPLIAQQEPDFVRGLLFDLILCCNLLQLYELQSQFLQCKYKLNLIGDKLELL